MSNNIKEWLAGLTARERIVLSVGFMVATVLLFYVYIWLPIQEDKHRLKNVLPQMRADAAWMRIASAEVSRIRGTLEKTGPSARSTGKIEQAIRETAKAQDIKDLSVTVKGANSAQVKAQSAPLDKALHLLEELRSNHMVTAKTIKLEALSEEGMVSLEALFIAR